MDIGQVIFDTIRNPDVAYVLLVLGLFTAIFAFAVPGTGLTEVAAGVCLVLSVIGLSQLPVNFAGVTLIIIGVGLFIIDLKLQSTALAIGGAITLGVGSIFLFEVTTTQPGVSLWLVGLVTLGSMAFFVFGLSKVVQAMRLPRKVDVQSAVGERGTVRVSLNETNQFTATAQMGSELWTVRSTAAIPAGTTVVVERIDGLIAHVKPVTSE